jgi:hypothetical protein
MLASSRPIPLFFIITIALLLCGAAFLRAKFDFNAGHMDEYDYLFVGRQLLAGREWASHIYIFGSDLSWYLLGWGERYLGGLTGARMIASGVGLFSLAGMYAFVYVLWRNHFTALIAVSLLSVQSIHVFISRFATYDIVSFTFFSLALAPLILACQRQTPSRYGYLILSIVLMSLSVTSKYVVILYLPFIAGLALLRAPRIGLLFGTSVGAVLLAYAALHWDALLILYRVQIQSVHGVSNGSAEYILITMFRYVWPGLLASVMAIAYVLYRDGLRSWRNQRSTELCLLVLLAVPMLFYHLNALNMISLFKHLVYANIFLLAASAWLITQLLQASQFMAKQSTLSGLLIAYALLNYQQLQQAEVAYADVSPVIKAIDHKLNVETTILSEDPYLFRYLGFWKMPQSHIKESKWLDNNRDGLYEKKDVVEALWDRKFSYVYLNDRLHPNLNKTIRKILTMRGYTAVLVESYQTSEVMSRQKKGSFGLYQRNQASTIPLQEDDLFQRGKAMKTFLERGLYE